MARLTERGTSCLVESISRGHHAIANAEVADAFIVKRVPREAQHPVAALQALKIALHKYAETYAPLPADQLAAVKLEMGDTLLTLIRAAEKLNIDLIRAAEDKVQLRAANLPHLVRLASQEPQGH